MNNDDRQAEEKQGRSDLVTKVRHSISRIPFAEEALAAYCCSVDPATPRHAKAVLVAALAYFIIPVDAIPDVIAGLGFTDDAAVFWGAWRSISVHVKDSHIDAAKRLLERIKGEQIS